MIILKDNLTSEILNLFFIITSLNPFKITEPLILKFIKLINLHTNYHNSEQSFQTEYFMLQ